MLRTEHDSFAGDQALMVWNTVRKHVGLPPLSREDLNRWCQTHKKYHVIREEYGCVYQKG